MQRQVRVDNLRTQDPVMLEIVLQGPLRRPIPQIEIGTLADMMALSELDTLPKALKRPFDGFTTRVASEVEDLPDGESFHLFCKAIGGLEPERVPASLRNILEREATRDGRSESGRDQVRSLLDVLAEVEPEVVVLGAVAPKIERGALKKVFEKRIGGKVEERPKRQRSSSRGSSGPSGAGRARLPADHNPERAAWLRDLLTETLVGKDNGLSETVLIAGCRHKAKSSSFHPIQPKHITEVLKSMEEAGVVRHSAGRWTMGKRW